MSTTTQRGANFDPAKLVTMSEAEFLTLAQAARKVPGKPSTATCWRWTTSGFLARNGQRIRLRSFRFGRALRIRADDITAFAEELARANAEGFTPAA